VGGDSRTPHFEWEREFEKICENEEFDRVFASPVGVEEGQLGVVGGRRDGQHQRRRLHTQLRSHVDRSVNLMSQ